MTFPGYVTGNFLLFGFAVMEGGELYGLAQIAAQLPNALAK